MATMQVLVPDETESTGYDAPFTTGTGRFSTTYSAPDGFQQWILTGQLADGSELRWAGAQGEEALYVASGVLVVDGRQVDAGGTLVVEAGVETVALASGDTRIVHFGSATPATPTDGPNGPPAADGHDVHLVPAQGLAPEPDTGRTIHSCFYADANCPTCRLVLFKVWSGESYTSSSHSHSQDELIHVLSGTLQVGRDQAGPGMTLAIPADRRYRFSSEGPWSFLNYRRDVSFITRNPKEPPAREDA